MFTRTDAKIKIVPGVPPAATRSAATVNGSAIDRRSLEVSGGGQWLEGNLILEVGAAAGAPTTISVTAKLQESADGSTGWTDVTDRDRIEASSLVVTAENTLTLLGFRCPGLKRYIRPVLVVAFTGGTSPTIFCNVSVLLGYPQRV